MFPIILYPNASSSTIRSHTDGHLLLTCTATAKPNLTESDFTWQRNGENVDEYASFTIDASDLDDGPHGLSHQWTSALTLAIPTSPPTCGNMELVNGNFRCIVQSVQSPNMVVETQRKCNCLHLWLYVYLKLLN